jgi:FkbM family methyltransferase
MSSDLARTLKHSLGIIRLPFEIAPFAVGAREKLGLLRYISINLLDKLRHDQRETTLQLLGHRYHVRTCSGELSAFPEIYRDNVYERVPGFTPKAKDIVLDIGANTGIFSLKQAARGASVYAFEPNPEAYSRLVRNVEENSLTGRIVVFREALGSRPGLAGLKTSSSTVVTRVEFNVRGDVKVGSLNDAIPALGLERVQLIKLDVEGAEAEVLAGGTRVLSRVERIVMEYHGQERLEQVREIMHEANFREVDSDEQYAYFVNANFA